MPTTPFDDFSEAYDAIVDWPKRLANEGPLFRRWFERHRVGRVVDVACGTGEHAVLFHGWGLEVEAADISPAMLERAMQRHSEPPGLRWVRRGFEEPIVADEPFDAAICVGNALALASDHTAAERVLRAMLAAVRPGGLVIAQALNLWRLPDGPCQWQKFRMASVGGEEVAVVKGVHRSGARGFVDLVVAWPKRHELRTESAPLLAFDPAQLADMVRRAGAGRVEWFGSYQEEPYVRETSVDLILIAVRAAESEATRT
jgi:SAM-dependent methyltransferase